MKTIQLLLSELEQHNTIPHRAAAAAFGALLPAWERELAVGKPAHKLLADIDNVISLLLRAQLEAGQVLLVNVPTQALSQLDKFNSGNDYQFVPESGESSVWIAMGDNVVAHISQVGGQVAVGLHANHELCTDEPLESCVLSQRTAKSFIRQTLRESEVRA